MSNDINVSPTCQQQEFIVENSALYQQAKEYPFEIFSKIYVKKEHMIDDKKTNEDDESKPNSERDDLIKHLFKIQKNIYLYQEGYYNEFLRVTEFKINKTADKTKLKEIIEGFANSSNGKIIEKVIEEADKHGICRKDDKFNSFVQKNEYVYNRVKTLPFSEFQNLYEHLEGRTAFSTQHKVKGAEFDNVLVVLDNGNWNKYNFNYLFQNHGTESVLERTQKLFYVCCTRAKENLVLYFHEPTPDVLSQAKKWFGKENVIEI